MEEPAKKLLHYLMPRLRDETIAGELAQQNCTHASPLLTNSTCAYYLKQRVNRKS
jgi:hypothetical protein